MDKLVIASLREGAGKTSVIVGMSEALGKRAGYMKPFGDRPLYQKKRIEDYDVALMTSLLSLSNDSDDICFGFDHSKLNYAYRDGEVQKRLAEAVGAVSAGKEVLFIEGGRDLMRGTYVHLGSLSLAKHTGSKLIVVISGNYDSIVDDVAFLKKYLDRTEIDFGGIIINKVKDVTNFKKTHLPKIKGIGLDILGVIPHQPELGKFPVKYLAEALPAKVITGEEHLDTVIEDILVGAMSVDVPLQKILSQNKNILMITSGDRSDMILAAIEKNTKALVLTNNIVPPSNIISKAEEMGIPMLLVPHDTYGAAKRIDEMVALTGPRDKDKVKLLGGLVKKHLDLKKLLS